MAAQTRQPFFDSEVLRLQAQSGLAAGLIDLDEARSLLQRAMDHANQRGAAGLELRVALTWTTVEPPEGSRPAIERLRSLLEALPEGAGTEDRDAAEAIVRADTTPA